MHIRQVISDPRARLKPCLRCGRSLLKNLDDRYCPGCGLSVWMSLNSNDALDRSRPEWLRRAARGVWILAVAQPVALAAYLVAWIGHELPTWSNRAIARAEWDEDTFAALAEEAASSTEAAAQVDAFLAAREAAMQTLREPSVPVAIALTLIGAFFLLSALGLFWLTVDERRYPDRVRRSRVAARVAAAVAVVIGLASLAAGLLHLPKGFPAHTGVASLSLLAIEVTFTAVACCGWLYLRPIARRGSRSGLAKLCGYLLFLPLLAFAKAAPLIGLWFLYMLMPLATLLPLAYLPLSTVLLVKFARMLQRAEPSASAAWAAESQPVAVAA